MAGIDTFRGLVGIDENGDEIPEGNWDIYTVWTKKDGVKNKYTLHHYDITDANGEVIGYNLIKADLMDWLHKWMNSHLNIHADHAGRQIDDADNDGGLLPLFGVINDGMYDPKMYPNWSDKYFKITYTHLDGFPEDEWELMPPAIEGNWYGEGYSQQFRFDKFNAYLDTLPYDERKKYAKKVHLGISDTAAVKYEPDDHRVSHPVPLAELTADELVDWPWDDTVVKWADPLTGKEMEYEVKNTTYTKLGVTELEMRTMWEKCND